MRPKGRMGVQITNEELPNLVTFVATEEDTVQKLKRANTV